MNNFHNLLLSNPDQYIGYGNPAADICFVGKESTGMLQLQCGLGSTNYWLTSLPMYFDRNKNDNPNDSIWKEGHTWNKYQKLHDVIFPEHAAVTGTMNFEQRVFLTEMSAIPAVNTATGKASDGFEEQLNVRKHTFFAHPYFKDFKVIVLACSDYIVNYGDRREIDNIFDVTFDVNGGAHEVGPQNAFWVHHSADGKRMVIHTRQLSGAVSDKMLEEMGMVIRQHLTGTPFSAKPMNAQPNNTTLTIGMSTDDCRAICGEPDRINTNTTASCVTEFWWYGRKMVTFSNGKISSIMN